MSVKFKFGFLVFTSLYLANTESYAETVPELLGKFHAEVASGATTENFDLIFDPVDSLKPVGKILLQIPEAGAVFGQDKKLYLQISNGWPVPNVVGLNRVQAENTIRSEGIQMAISNRRHVGIAEGLVASQVPAAGERIDASREIVFLDLSSGLDVIVPDVIGSSLAEAAEILASSELSSVSDPPDPDLYIEGGLCGTSYRLTTRITSSSPPQGSRVSAGSTITMKYETLVASSIENGPCNDEGVPY